MMRADWQREPAPDQNRGCSRTIATRNDDGRDATSKPSGVGAAMADPNPALPNQAHVAGPIALR